jgi:exonuclease SbcC/exonuclease SbcD
LTPEAVQGFDLVCLGHIHRAQKCANREVFYAGSPERLSFNEADCDPGFWIHAVPEPGDKDTLESWFVPTPARKYITVRFNDDAEDETAYAVRELISGGSAFAAMSRDDEVRDAIVRVHIKADEKQAKELSRKAIEKSFHDAGAYFVQEIKIDAERRERARDKEVTEGIGPVEALLKWCAKQGIEDGDTRSLADMTRELLEEVA